MKISVIGLGAGTIAALLQPGDQLRFYEINSAVIDINEEYFTYLHDSKGDVEVVLADGRIGLEKDLASDGPGTLDVIVIDAFSGDAVPVHLLTLEAFELYFRYLKPDGILIVHITNKHLDLTPVLRAAAQAVGITAAKTVSANVGNLFTSSDWIIMTRNEEFLRHPAVRRIDDKSFALDEYQVLWTDDYSSLLDVLY